MIWGFTKNQGDPNHIDPQIVGFSYNMDPKKVPLISETLNPKPLGRWGLGVLAWVGAFWLPRRSALTSHLCLWV